MSTSLHYESARSAHNTGEPALSMSNITLTFPDGASRVTAVDDVTLAVHKGELVALTGASGSGKSSLMAVAATLIRPDSGLAQVGGTELTTLSDAEQATMRRDTIGIVFQQSNLVSSLTALEQLTVMDRLHNPFAGFTAGGRRKRKETEDRARHLLARMGLEDSMDRKPGALSGGQRQRVNLARALMAEPELMLVDEPTSALDSVRTAAVMDLLLDVVREQNVATLLITHDRDAADRADREVTMNDGRLYIV